MENAFLAKNTTDVIVERYKQDVHKSEARRVLDVCTQPSRINWENKQKEERSNRGDVITRTMSTQHPPFGLLRNKILWHSLRSATYKFNMKLGSIPDIRACTALEMSPNATIDNKIIL